jgi:hypothetical protein
MRSGKDEFGVGDAGLGIAIVVPIVLAPLAIPIASIVLMSQFYAQLDDADNQTLMEYTCASTKCRRCIGSWYSSRESINNNNLLIGRANVNTECFILALIPLLCSLLFLITATMNAATKSMVQTIVNIVFHVMIIILYIVAIVYNVVEGNISLLYNVGENEFNKCDVYCHKLPHGWSGSHCSSKISNGESELALLVTSFVIQLIGGTIFVITMFCIVRYEMRIKERENS